MDTSEHYAQFWKRVRVERGLTQQKLADLLGIRFQFISAVERGDSHYSLEQTRRLVRKFKLNVNEVIEVVMEGQDVVVRSAFRAAKKSEPKRGRKKILRA